MPPTLAQMRLDMKLTKQGVRDLGNCGTKTRPACSKSGNGIHFRGPLEIVIPGIYEAKCVWCGEVIASI
jgi:hypothetical protein